MFHPYLVPCPVSTFPLPPLDFLTPLPLFCSTRPRSAVVLRPPCIPHPLPPIHPLSPLFFLFLVLHSPSTVSYPATCHLFPAPYPLTCPLSRCLSLPHPLSPVFLIFLYFHFRSLRPLFRHTTPLSSPVPYPLTCSLLPVSHQLVCPLSPVPHFPSPVPCIYPPSPGPIP